MDLTSGRPGPSVQDVLAADIAGREPGRSGPLDRALRRDLLPDRKGHNPNPSGLKARYSLHLPCAQKEGLR
jgi:hypothetical protein